MVIMHSVYFIISSILLTGRDGKEQGREGREGTGLNTKWCSKCTEHLVSDIFVCFLHTLHSFNILSSVFIIRGTSHRAA